MKRLLLLLSLSFFITCIYGQIPTAGNVLWLMADQGVCNNISGAPASYGDLVAIWKDQSGNGNDFRQDTAAQRPQLTLPGSPLCVKPSIRFDVGRATYLCSPLKLSGPLSVFIVFVSPSLTNNPETLLSIKGVSNTYTEILCTDHPSYQRLSYMAGMPGSVSGGTTFNSVGSNVSLSVNGNLLTMIYDGGNPSSSSSYSANFDASSSPVAPSGLFGRLMHDSTTLGGRAPEQNFSFLSGDIAEVIVYDRVLTPIEITQAENYLVAKYGLNGSCVPLPVRLEEFNARADRQEVLLNWKVADGADIDHYIVQHRTDVTQWDDIAEILSGQMNNLSSAYQYIHRTPARHTNYYRIKMIGHDGKQAFSVIKPVSITNAACLSVIYNPANDLVTVQSAADERLTVSIISSTGLLEKEIIVFNKSQLSTRSLPAGIHFIKVSGKCGTNTKAILKK